MVGFQHWLGDRRLGLERLETCVLGFELWVRTSTFGVELCTGVSTFGLDHGLGVANSDWYCCLSS